jgi:flagellar basal body P-ring protein FlgI
MLLAVTAELHAATSRTSPASRRAFQQLVDYGLVVGLPAAATARRHLHAASVSSMLEKTVVKPRISKSNVAAVMVTAICRPCPHGQPSGCPGELHGDPSASGGTLLMTLKGPTAGML